MRVKTQLQKKYETLAKIFPENFKRRKEDSNFNLDDSDDSNVS